MIVTYSLLFLLLYIFFLVDSPKEAERKEHKQTSQQKTKPPLGLDYSSLPLHQTQDATGKEHVAQAYYYT